MSPVENIDSQSTTFLEISSRRKMKAMCGRYTLRSKPSEIAAAFGLFDVPADLTPRYNVAPTQSVLAVVFDSAAGRRRLRPLVWGLVPPWADDPKIGNQLLNARAETIAEKPSFRDAFAHRRCLLVADGFYEWRRDGKAKQPFHIRRRDGRPFGLAGLFEHWQGNGRVIDSCTVVTTTPNELMAPLHDRMPVILDEADYTTWLDTNRGDVAQLQLMLKPAASQDWEAVEVGPTVNSARNETPECLAPPDEPKPKIVNRTLF